jgi:hypothetical protein
LFTTFANDYSLGLAGLADPLVKLLGPIRHERRRTHDNESLCTQDTHNVGTVSEQVKVRIAEDINTDTNLPGLFVGDVVQREWQWS